MKKNKTNTLYQRVRDLREDMDYTQAQVAEILNLHRTQYTRYENAISPVPADFIVSIAKLYNVSTDYILGLTNDKRKLW